MFPNVSAAAARAVAIAGVLVLASPCAVDARAAVTYSFEWFCSGCPSTVGSASSGREGPFASPSACEAARASMAASLDSRGCGMGCFNPQLCRGEGVAETAPPSPPPGASPQIRLPPASDGPRDARGAAPAGREGEDAEREARQAREQRKPGAPAPSLARRWRNAFSRYEVRKSASGIEIVLVETCAAADCRRKIRPDRLVFRGKQEGDRLAGVVIVRPVSEIERSAACPQPAGEFPIEGRLSADGGRLSWGRAQLATQAGCPRAALSLGVWRREP